MLIIKGPVLLVHVYASLFIYIFLDTIILTITYYSKKKIFKLTDTDNY